MKLTRSLFITAALAASAIGAGVYLYSPQNDKSASAPVAARPDAASAILSASFYDLNGQMQHLSQWRNKVIVVNFWATWCPPCRTEIPDFIKLQEKYGKQGLIFVGIAIDQKDKVQAFSDEMGINYPVLLGELEAIELSKSAGNRLGGLPYTAIIDRNGKIAATEIGGLTEAKLDAIIKPLL